MAMINRWQRSCGESPFCRSIRDEEVEFAKKLRELLSTYLFSVWTVISNTAYEYLPTLQCSVPTQSTYLDCAKIVRKTKNRRQIKKTMKRLKNLICGNVLKKRRDQNLLLAIWFNSARTKENKGAKNYVEISQTRRPITLIIDNAWKHRQKTFYKAFAECGNGI
ncbi:unnamed protein product, partial [Mesorhabditis spiculigera]